MKQGQAIELIDLRTRKSLLHPLRVSRDQGPLIVVPATPQVVDQSPTPLGAQMLLLCRTQADVQHYSTLRIACRSPKKRKSTFERVKANPHFPTIAVNVAQRKRESMDVRMVSVVRYLPGMASQCVTSIVYHLHQTDMPRKVLLRSIIVLSWTRARRPLSLSLRPISHRDK